MLVRVGRRGGPTDAPAALIRACHDRLRFFTGLASRLATEPALTDAEVTEAAERIVRYFTEALPHHEADEDQSIAPRLRGASAEVDAALDRVAREHAAAETHVGRLVALTAILVGEPRRRSELERELRTVADSLLDFYEAHLAIEEAVIVPALEQSLTSEEQAVVLAEMRARRGGSREFPGGPPARAGASARKAG